MHQVQHSAERLQEAVAAFRSVKQDILHAWLQHFVSVHQADKVRCQLELASEEANGSLAAECYLDTARDLQIWLGAQDRGCSQSCPKRPASEARKSF